MCSSTHADFFPLVSELAVPLKDKQTFKACFEVQICSDSQCIIRKDRATHSTGNAISFSSRLYVCEQLFFCCIYCFFILKGNTGAHQFDIFPAVSPVPVISLAISVTSEE